MDFRGPAVNFWKTRPTSLPNNPASKCQANQFPWHLAKEWEDFWTKEKHPLGEIK